VFRFLLHLLDLFLNLWFYLICPICDRPAVQSGLCVACQPIQPLHGKLCQKCGAPLALTMEECGACLLAKNNHLDQVRSFLALTEQAKKVVHMIKYQGRYEWISLFSSHIQLSGYSSQLEDFTLVPVPISANKFCRRGFNQAEILAEMLSRKSGLALHHGLKKVKDTLPQSQLNKEQRRRNLKGSFEWISREKAPEKVVLVDDIYTTGETLAACARILKLRGTESVLGWTLFRTL
jgi:ComF family protein